MAEGQKSEVGSAVDEQVAAVFAVIGAVVAMAIWFLCFSGGGIGPGTV